MMVYASMAASGLTTCANGSNRSPKGTMCDIRHASLPGLSLSPMQRTTNLAVTHDRRRSFSMLDLSDNEWCSTNDQQVRRRPSFPQGVVDCRTRHRIPEDRRKRQVRRKPVSICLSHDSDDGGQSGRDSDRMSIHERSCPLYQQGKSRKELPTTCVITDETGENSQTNITSSSFCVPSEPSLSSNLYMIQCNCRLGQPNPLRHNNINGSDDNYEEKQNHNEDGYHLSRRSKRRKIKNNRETVIINVGGQIFETYRSTLNRLRTPIFHSEDKMEVYYRKSHNDYFFDRDPTAFGSILNFLRTGELHIPTNMCGPALQNELAFWGIEEADIARCCWTQYNTWKTQCRSLEKLENDRKFSTTQETTHVDANGSCWERCKSNIWTFLQDPGSSKKAKAYAWVSIIFVFVSIFSFCAETHPIFKVKARDMIHFSSFYEFFTVQSIPWAQVIALAKGNATVLTDLTQVSQETPTSGMNFSAGNYTTGKTGGISKRAIGKHDYNYGCDYRLAHENSKTSDDDDKDLGNKDLPHPALVLMDIVCLIFFTVEYLTRFICSPSKINFLRALQNIVDFLAFAPDYVELLFLIIDPHQNEGVAIMEMLFILRILRLFRIFRLIRHVPGLWILLYTLKASFNELMLMCVFLLIGMVVFATLVHFVEPDGTFNNIPVGFWWSVVTMTTVGYGDMYPQSAAGYVIGSCCAVAGLLMIAFTVPIIVSNFVLYYTHVQYGLARRDREIERLKEDNESDVFWARSRSNADNIDMLMSKTSFQQASTTTRNGKSYINISSRSDQGSSSQSSPERELHDQVTSRQMMEHIV